MLLFSTISETINCLETWKREGKTIGLVPTMGALHSGHVSLLERAKKECDIAVASIFVNPLQFNDPKDLARYPRNLEKDSEILNSCDCDVLFAPSAQEIYPPEIQKEQLSRDLLDLGDLDRVMEAVHRPGHFQGVCKVVKRLFDIVQPKTAYFGDKDFQQVAVIKHMVSQLKLDVQIVACPTIREADGLAMSSRNVLLSREARASAPLIYKTLTEVKNKKSNYSVVETESWVIDTINKDSMLEVEYFEIVNAKNLSHLSKWNEAAPVRACIAVNAKGIRLIDNLEL